MVVVQKEKLFDQLAVVPRQGQGLGAADMGVVADLEPASRRRFRGRKLIDEILRLLLARRLQQLEDLVNLLALLPLLLCRISHSLVLVVDAAEPLQYVAQLLSLGQG